MRLLKRSFLFFPLSFILLSASPVPAQETGASWLRTRAGGNALNPNISVIGDFLGSTGPRADENSNRFSFREAEVGIQAAVDPYARADFFIGIHEGESPELEEGFITLLALPWGLQARGGKFLAGFGRLNMVHAHELPQTDRPLVLSRFLGEEGLNSTGLEVSRIFAPFGLFTEVSYAFLNGLESGHGHGEEEPRLVYVTGTDENGNPIVDAGGTPVRLPVEVHEPEEHQARGLRRFAHASRIRFYQDLTEASNLELGVSGALHEPEGHEQRRLGAVDLTFRWKPLREGLYKSFIWRTEGLYSWRKLEEETDLGGTVVAPERELDRRGVYSYVEFQPARRWRFGVRGDYAEDPEVQDESFTRPDGSVFTAEKSITRAVSPYVTMALSEFQRFRVQYQHKRLPDRQEEDRGFLQWTVVLGPHGAHAF